MLRINARTHARAHTGRCFTRAVSSFLLFLHHFSPSSPPSSRPVRFALSAARTNLSSRYVLHRFHALCARGAHASEEPYADEMIKHCAGRGGVGGRDVKFNFIRDIAAKLLPTPRPRRRISLSAFIF